MINHPELLKIYEHFENKTYFLVENNSFCLINCFFFRIIKEKFKAKELSINSVILDLSKIMNQMD